MRKQERKITRRLDRNCKACSIQIEYEEKPEIGMEREKERGREIERKENVWKIYRHDWNHIPSIAVCAKTNFIVPKPS